MVSKVSDKGNLTTSNQTSMYQAQGLFVQYQAKIQIQKIKETHDILQVPKLKKFQV